MNFDPVSSNKFTPSSEKYHKDGDQILNEFKNLSKVKFEIDFEI